MKRTFFTTLMFLLASAANAAVDCNEQLTQLITHQDGYVYFTTNQTCTSWCRLNMSSPDANSKGYAMMLTAMTSGKSVRFYWPNISSCTSANAQYASPGYLYLVP